jgi:hypothetical protein
MLYNDLVDQQQLLKIMESERIWNNGRPPPALESDRKRSEHAKAIA